MKPCDCFMCNGFFIDDEECAFDTSKSTQPPDLRHVCKPKEYIGLVERYFYCEDCNKKIED
jgi:hypothetical protein